MATAVTKLRSVGAAVILAILVGQGSPACSPSAPAPRVAEVALDIPRMDAGNGPTSAAGRVVFAHPSARVGARWRVTLHAESVSDDASGHQLTTYDSESLVEVLAVDGPAATRFRVRFDRNVNAYQSAESPTPIHGKTYVVDVSAPHVRDERGAAATPDETERVENLFPDLGTRARVDEALPDEPAKIGDRRDDLARAILRVLHPRLWSADAATAVLGRVEGADAVFLVTLDASSTSGTKMHRAGEATVRTSDAVMSHVVLAGDYEPGAGNAHGVFKVERRVAPE